MNTTTARAAGTRKGAPMEVMGIILTVIVVVAIVFAAAVALRSIPDMRRYLRMRRM